MDTKIPKCFISYSWDSSEHQKWVRELATNLHNLGVMTQLDQWDLKPGQDMMEFMEFSIRTSDFVLLICTPNFAEKANAGRGGVGYEKSVVTGEIFYSTSDTTKFIPILTQGTPKESLPSFLKSKVYIDFRDVMAYNLQFEELLRNIYDTPKFPKPSLGNKPDFSKPLKIGTSSNETKDVFEFQFSDTVYKLTLPEWWQNVNVDLSQIKVNDKNTIEDNVRKIYGKDVGTKENWQFAFKTYALYFQQAKRFPVYMAHCASSGGDHDLAVKIYSELYHLIDLSNEKIEWYQTYLAYEAAGEYEEIGQIGLAISWYKKSTEFLASSDRAIQYYADKSLKQIELLTSSK